MNIFYSSNQLAVKKDKQILIQKIRNGIVNPFNEELIKLIKPAIRILPKEKQSTKDSYSKFGGLPLIKKEEKWLRSAKENKPYAFLLQLDLEELKKHDIEQLLPEKGILSFWFNLETWDEGKVIYHQEKKHLIAADPPIELEEERNRRKLPIWKRMFTKRHEFKLFPECSIKFEVEYHAPSWDSLQMELFHSRNKSKSQDLEIDEKYIDEYTEGNKSDHHLLGYYVGLQESTYELMKFTNGRYLEKINEDLIKKGLDWILLSQIDSDATTDMSWADWGKILFFIHEKDLKNKDFSNVFIQLDTT